MRNSSPPLLRKKICTQAPPIECSLGSLANGEAKATVTVVVLPMAPVLLVASALVEVKPIP